MHTYVPSGDSHTAGQATGPFGEGRRLQTAVHTTHIQTHADRRTSWCWPLRTGTRAVRTWVLELAAGTPSELRGSRAGVS